MLTFDLQPEHTTLITISGLIGYIVSVILYWRIFTKAGRAGWLAFIPIVNTIVLIQISGHSGWLVLLYIIPIVDFVWAIIFANHLGKTFGKGGVFSFFLLFLVPVIGLIVLAFDGSVWRDRSVTAV